MPLKKSHIYISLIMYFGIIAIIIFVNAKISKKFDIVPTKKSIDYVNQKITIKPSNRKTIKIDPLNDPLAPRINPNIQKKLNDEKLKQQAQENKVATANQNEVPLDSPILNQ